MKRYLHWSNSNIVGEDYRFPVTLSLIGVRGHPQAVKATMYNPEECMESGTLFLLQPENWKKIPDPTEKKRQKRYTIPMAMKTEYQLYEILLKGGFELLNKALVYDETTKLTLLGAKALHSLLRLDLLENHINISNLIAFIKESSQELELFDMQLNK